MTSSLPPYIVIILSSFRNIQISGDLTETMKVTPFGAGAEVGRSCILLEYQGMRVLLDCGVHPGRKGLDALPLLKDIENLETIDLVLVTHFHLDHAAALPYLTEHTSFKGAIYMTYPTKAVMQMILKDYIRVSTGEEELYNAADLKHCCDKIQGLDFHQEIDYHGIKFQAYQAGHVIGAAMFCIDIAGTRILYTGDYSHEEDRHLMAAELPSLRPEVLIVESTYGTQTHQPRIEREKTFTDFVVNIVNRGGRCLVPIFALGRAQELLLILDEYWSNHPALQHIPIYYASQLVNKAIKIFQISVNMMNDKIKRQTQTRNPFFFTYISNLTSLDNFEDPGPCVVLSSPGMLQSGISRTLFERWCGDPKNGVILPGYCVEGTLAKDLLTNSNATEVETMNGTKIPRKCSIHYISFSAHSDYPGTRNYIKTLAPPHVVLVHGEKNQMLSLKKQLELDFAIRKQKSLLNVYNPVNCSAVSISCVNTKSVKLVGNIANRIIKPNSTLDGVLIYKDYSHLLVDAAEISNYTQLPTYRLFQKQSIPFNSNFDLLCSFLEAAFDHIDKKIAAGGRPTVQIENKAVELCYIVKDSKIQIEWTSSPVNDMIVDSIVTIIMQTQYSPASVRLSALPLLTSNNNVKKEENENEKKNDEKKKKAEDVLHQSILNLLVAEYGDAYYNEEEGYYEVDNGRYIMNLETNSVFRKMEEEEENSDADPIYVRLLHTKDRLMLLTKPFGFDNPISL